MITKDSGKQFRFVGGGLMDGGLHFRADDRDGEVVFQGYAIYDVFLSSISI